MKDLTLNLVHKFGVIGCYCHIQTLLGGLVAIDLKSIRNRLAGQPCYTYKLGTLYSILGKENTCSKVHTCFKESFKKHVSDPFEYATII
jgi:Predicted membrane protein